MENIAIAVMLAGTDERATGQIYNVGEEEALSEAEWVRAIGAAAGWSGTDGSVNENKFFNSWPDSLEENMKFLDVLGSPETYNHYPISWAMAFNTSFKMFKR